MKKALIISSMIVCLSSTAFGTKLESMSKGQIKDTFEGKTFTTITLAKLNGNFITDSFSGYFEKDGKIFGKWSTKPDDAAQTDEGTWTVKDDGKLCATWNSWNNSKEICVYAYKLKNAVVFVEANQYLETVVLDSEIKAGNQLSS